MTNESTNGIALCHRHGRLASVELGSLGIFHCKQTDKGMAMTFFESTEGENDDHDACVTVHLSASQARWVMGKLASFLEGKDDKPTTPPVSPRFPWDSVSIRVRNAFTRAAVGYTPFVDRPRTIDDMLRFTRSGIEQMRGIADSGLKEVDRIMDSHGLLEEWKLS